MFSETDIRGTVCGKSARTGLWGSGEVTNRSTRKELTEIRNPHTVLPLDHLLKPYIASIGQPNEIDTSTEGFCLDDILLCKGSVCYDLPQSIDQFKMNRSFCA